MIIFVVYFMTLSLFKKNIRVAYSDEAEGVPKEALVALIEQSRHFLRATNENHKDCQNDYSPSKEKSTALQLDYPTQPELSHKINKIS
jgi:hypothetical protein